jgi:hypothetical protein
VSTNYFNIPTFRPATQYQPPAVNFKMPEMPTLPQGMDASVMGNAAAPNYAMRNLYLGQLGSGGAIATKYKGLMQARQGAAKAQTRGYGGINWRDDDLSTPENESLTPTYESDKMGQYERDAYNAALARGASSGVSYSTAGDQLVGAALQRVSDEAAKTISQYAGDINTLANQQLTESQTALTNYMSLYGADAEWALKQTVPATPAPPNPESAPPDQIVARGGTVQPTNEFVNGKTVYSGSRAPNVNAYKSRFSASKGYTVQVFKPDKKGGKYRVVVTYAYNPAAPAAAPSPDMAGFLAGRGRGRGSGR